MNLIHRGAVLDWMRTAPLFENSFTLNAVFLRVMAEPSKYLFNCKLFPIQIRKGINNCNSIQIVGSKWQQQQQKPFGFEAWINGFWSQRACIPAPPDNTSHIAEVKDHQLWLRRYSQRINAGVYRLFLASCPMWLWISLLKFGLVSYSSGHADKIVTIRIDQSK